MSEKLNFDLNQTRGNGMSRNTNDIANAEICPAGGEGQFYIFLAGRGFDGIPSLYLHADGIWRENVTYHFQNRDYAQIALERYIREAADGDMIVETFNKVGYLGRNNWTLELPKSTPLFMSIMPEPIITLNLHEARGAAACLRWLDKA